MCNNVMIGQDIRACAAVTTPDHTCANPVATIMQNHQAALDAANDLCGRLGQCAG
jgi:hypothetical protein